MPPLSPRLVAWFVATPTDSLRRWSVVAAVAGSAFAFADTARLLWLIVAGEVVAVPRFDALQVTAWTVVAALGTWAVGMVAFAVPHTRVSLGWVAPLGVVASSALDRQVFTSITYLIALAFAMHWWSARLERRPATSHLWGVPLRVLQTQISIVFLWTAIAKLNPRFLSGAVLSVSFGGPVPPPQFVLDRQVLVVLAVFTVAAEVALAIALWIGTLRRWALAGVAGFHGFILAFFRPTVPLLAFALIMGSGYLLFASEPWQEARRRTVAKST